MSCVSGVFAVMGGLADCSAAAATDTRLAGTIQREQFSNFYRSLAQIANRDLRAAFDLGGKLLDLVAAELLGGTVYETGVLAHHTRPHLQL